MNRAVPLVAATVVLATLGGVAGLWTTGGADAAVNATVANRGSTFATTALYAPGSLAATAVGHDVALTWPAGRNGDGYRLLGGPATGSSCTGAALAPVAATSTTAFTDTGRYAPQGSWYCYQVQTSYGPWTSVPSNPTAAVQLGVVATGVTLANGGHAGRLDTGDTITITFNQAIDPATGPSPSDTVCTDGRHTIVLGDTRGGRRCRANAPTSVGTLTGGNPNRSGTWDATYRWSAGDTVLTITLGRQIQGRTVRDRGSWTFQPDTASTVLRSATGAQHVCDTNAGGGTCLPAATGGF